MELAGGGVDVEPAYALAVVASATAAALETLLMRDIRRIAKGQEAFVDEDEGSLGLQVGVFGLRFAPKATPAPTPNRLNFRGATTSRLQSGNFCRTFSSPARAAPRPS